ncbi:MAG: agmatine deiminase [Bacteriovoracaceae bacterium]|nr:agmatine deiminase [Bacteriovoracaceae bacterium]
MFSYPAEWTPHDACWLAWPSARDLWEEDLDGVQLEFVEFCRAIKGEKLNILVSDSRAEASAKETLKDLAPNFFSIPYGDIWLRDTAPLFLKSKDQKTAAARFSFNGWGNKYNLPHDPQIASRISETLSKNIKTVSYTWVLEGGSLEVDDVGTCLTTEQCLLNPNRNPSFSKSVIETKLKDSLGVKKILWLKDGLLNDHTDGHIDTLARFAPNGFVICMRAQKDSDPNAQTLEKISNDLSTFTNAMGERLKILEIPSPGEIKDEDGILMPASYVNFYISNEAVIVPTYESDYDEQAVNMIGQYFPDRKTIGRSAKNILKGGGAFHCITQQVPS